MKKYGIRDWFTPIIVLRNDESEKVVVASGKAAWRSHVFMPNSNPEFRLLEL